MAFEEGPAGPAGPYPERLRVRQRKREIQRSMTRAGLGLAALTAGAALWAIHKRSK
jgi:hypothetical protein